VVRNAAIAHGDAQAIKVFAHLYNNLLLVAWLRILCFAHRMLLSALLMLLVARAVTSAG
jgi:hypothetical protein